MFVSASKYKKYASGQLAVIHQADDMRRCAIIGFYLANSLVLLHSVYGACIFVISLALSYFTANLIRHYGYVAASMSREFDGSGIEREDTLYSLLHQFQVVTKLAKYAQVQSVFWLAICMLLGPILFAGYMTTRKFLFTQPVGMAIWTFIMFMPAMIYCVIAWTHRNDLSYISAAKPHTSAESMREGQQILFSVEPTEKTLDELMT